MAVMKVGAAGIETISGALKRPKKQNGHSHDQQGARSSRSLHRSSRCDQDP